MGGRRQLLGAGHAVGLPRASRPGHREALQRAAAGCDGAAARGEIALPEGCRRTLGHCCSLIDDHWCAPPPVSCDAPRSGATSPYGGGGNQRGNAHERRMKTRGAGVGALPNARPQWSAGWPSLDDQRLASCPNTIGLASWLPRMRSSVSVSSVLLRSLLMFMSQVSAVPSHTKRSTRLPRSGSVNSSSVPSPSRPSSPEPRRWRSSTGTRSRSSRSRGAGRCPAGRARRRS